MKIRARVGKDLAVLGVVAAAFTLYFALERPWFLRWGATEEEVAAALPGDEFVLGAPLRSTRAITIDAPVQDVWPWLAQLGQDRGGFYSFELLEDLVGCEMPRTSRILPEEQAWKLGDRLWMYPPDKLDGLGGAPLVAYGPGRHLAFATRQLGTAAEEPENGIWSFHLFPIDERSTRLVVRSLGAGGMGVVATAFHHGLFEPAHFVMERRMMTNIEALAEGRSPSKAWEDATAVLWTLTIVLMFASAVAVARREHWIRPLGVGAAALLVFQLLTLAQPSPGAGMVLVAVLAYCLWRREVAPPKHRIPPWTAGYGTRPFSASASTLNSSSAV